MYSLITHPIYSAQNKFLKIMFSVYETYEHRDWYSMLSTTSVSNDSLRFLIESDLSTRPILCHYAY